MIMMDDHESHDDGGGGNIGIYWARHIIARCISLLLTSPPRNSRLGRRDTMMAADVGDRHCMHECHKSSTQCDQQQSIIIQHQKHLHRLTSKTSLLPLGLLFMSLALSPFDARGDEIGLHRLHWFLL